MGEIADMILEGLLDQHTGEYIDDEISRQGGCGYPRNIKGHHKKTGHQSYSPNGKLRGLKKYIEKTVTIKSNTVLKRYWRDNLTEVCIKDLPTIAVEIKSKPFNQFRRWLISTYSDNLINNQ